MDAVIVGAGPAGLTAATYLGRFRRSALVLDGAQSRARWIPESHNIPGFAKGIGGPALLEELRVQALKYGATIVPGTASSIAPVAGGFMVSSSGGDWIARFVLLATGIVDTLPQLEGVEDAVRRGLLKLCPICDAYEAIDRKIAVIGQGEHAQREAAFLRTYSPHVSLLTIGEPPTAPDAERLAARGIEIVKASLADIRLGQDRLEVLPAGGAALCFDLAYAAMGCAPQNSLAVALGATTDENMGLLVTGHQETSVPGIYAAGDLVRGLNQVVVACAEAAIAATDMHNKLRQMEG